MCFSSKKTPFFSPFFPSIALFLRPPGPTNLTLSSSQATEHGVKLTVAMRMTGSTCALSTLYGQVDRFRKRKAEEELAGISPLKLGRKSSLPKEFTQALAVHSIMMQVSGEGEMSSIKMRTLATAMTLGTPHEGKLTDAHIWKMTRHRHPEYIKPAQAVDNEDRREGVCAT